MSDEHDIIREQFELHDQRFEQLESRVEALEEKREKEAEATMQKREFKLTWAVLILVAFEVLLMLPDFIQKWIVHSH